ncbi:MAG: homoserine kinase [Myxococcota bacterium]
MALLTPLPAADATRLAAAHGLGAVTEVTPIAGGSVNSNFFLDMARPGGPSRVFLRVYEEQDTDGVAFEWALLKHLEDHGVPVPARLRGPRPGELRVAGKPVALFALAAGRPSCQGAVTAARARAVGAFLGRAHRVTRSFGWRRRSRFEPASLRTRIAAIRARLARDPDPAVSAALPRLEAELDRAAPSALPGGVVHGDLFRDNVFFEGDALVAAIDWESAALGSYAYDVAVTLLAWCYGDDLDLGLVAALLGGYAAVRRPSSLERHALEGACRAAATRFAITRITDFHFRRGSGQVQKAFQRFVDRLDAIDALPADALADRWAP